MVPAPAIRSPRAGVGAGVHEGSRGAHGDPGGRVDPPDREEGDVDRVVHFEIPADDVSRATEFYGSVFGWELQEYEMGSGT